MNGARSTYMRKGYLLTALAAAVLLAASSGTAWAQVNGVVSHGEGGVLITMPSKVTEGETATINVSVMGTVDATTTTETTVTLTFAGGTQEPKGTNGPFAADGTAGADDFRFYPGGGVLELKFPANTSDAVSTVYTRRGSIELDTKFDRDAEDEYVTVTVTSTNIGNPTIAAKHTTIDDVDTQTYTISLTDRRGMYKEGGTVDDAISVDLEADPYHVQGTGRISLRVADEDGNVLRTYPVVGDQPVGVGGGADEDDNVKTVVINTPKNDKNRVADTVTIEALMGTAGDYVKVGSLDVTVADLHMLPDAAAITAVAKDKARNGKTVTEIVEGGDPVYLTVTVDRGTARSNITGEDLTVDIRPADPAQVTDYDLSVSRISLEGQDTGKQSNDVGLELKLSALSDEDVGAEDLVLNLVVSGPVATGADTATGTFTVAIMDETEPKIWPLPEAEAYPAITDAMEAGAGENGFNPGESFMVMTSDLFGLAEGYTASYKASVEGDAVSISASGESLKVNAETAGTAKVTVTGTAKMAASSFLPEQTVSNMASITFEVMVADKVLVVMLEMPANVMNGNIVEGESYEIMVSANRMVMEDTEVMIMRDRSASDAGEDDYSVSMATIMAGYDSATAELMVTEDMMPDSGTNDNMGEMLVLYGMVGDMETNSLTFTIWDQAVPVLPLFGQLLLALFLMLGGARLYRRRQQG